MTSGFNMFGTRRSKYIERSPRYDYLSFSNIVVEEKKLDITVKNISCSGLLIEFNNRDRDIVKRSIEIDRSYRIAIPYGGVFVAEQVTVVRMSTFCGSIISGCRFDHMDTEDEIVIKRMRFISTLCGN